MSMACGSKACGPFDTVRHGLCRSFQDVRIFPFLTAIENVLVAMPDQRGETIGGLFLPGARAQERANRDKARRLLQAVALESAAERPAGELPFGQQKLLVAAACGRDRRARAAA